MNGSTRTAKYRALGDGFVGVWIPYDDRHRAKVIPGARWDPNIKCWRVPAMFADEARQLVADLNGGIDTALSATLVSVLRSTPIPLRPATYKALVKVWHPDTGGDLRMMQALTAAWDEVKP